MPDATARVVPDGAAAVPEQTAQDAAVAAEQMAHAATCGICATVVHALFAAAWRGGSPGARAGEAASIIGRAFCANARPAGAQATPAELARAAGGAVDAYLDEHGDHVPDHDAFRAAIGATIAGALRAAGEVTIHDGPTRH